MIESNYLPRTVALTARLASAAAGGVAAGVVTLWLQGRLSGNWNVLANSGAVWTVVAVAIAGLLGTSAVSSAAAGVLALVGEVGGYYWCAAPWHGVAVGGTEQILWTAAAVVIGPFAGLAARGIVRGSATQRVVSGLCVIGVVLGEGVYTLRYLPEHHEAGVAELVVSALATVVAIATSRAPLRTRLGAIVLGLVVAALVLMAYREPVVL